jgi:CheY-like chemotaxis protein
MDQSTSKVHILLAEGDSRNCYALALVFGGLAYWVTVATNGEAALAAADPCDLFLTDLRMPRLDGFQLIDGLCALRPILLVAPLTANFLGAAIPRSVGLVTGVCQILVKPVEQAALRAAVERGLAFGGR